MARTRMVTRTIQSTKVIALCLDIAEQKPYEGEYILSGTFNNPKKLMKVLESTVNDDTHKVVHIKSTEICESLYGMSEQEFISYAKILPPRNGETIKE